LKITAAIFVAGSLGIARDLATFDSLIKRSPFSLPTPPEPPQPPAEAGRYQMTGMWSVDGSPRILVRDTTAQQPESFVVSQNVTPWSRGIKLVELTRTDDSSKSTARISTEGGEVLTIDFAPPPPMPIAAANPLPLPGGGAPGVPNVVNPAGLPTGMPPGTGTRIRRPFRGGMPQGVSPGTPGGVMPAVPTNRPTAPNVPLGSVPQPGSFNAGITTVSAPEEALPRRYDSSRPPRRNSGDPTRVIQRSSIPAPTPASGQ